MPISQRQQAIDAGLARIPERRPEILADRIRDDIEALSAAVASSRPERTVNWHPGTPATLAFLTPDSATCSAAGLFAAMRAVIVDGLYILDSAYINCPQASGAARSATPSPAGPVTVGDIRRFAEPSFPPVACPPYVRD